MPKTNQRAAGKGGIPALLHAGRTRPALPDHGYYSPGANSFNHYAFGSVGEWVWRTVAGINPDEANPGYRNVVIKPEVGGGLTSASGSFDSISGSIGSSWVIISTTNSYTLNVPPNATASFYLPATNLDHTTESGQPATNAIGVLSFVVTNGSTLFRLGSGVYCFTNWP